MWRARKGSSKLSASSTHWLHPALMPAAECALNAQLRADVHAKCGLSTAHVFPVRLGFIIPTLQVFLGTLRDSEVERINDKISQVGFVAACADLGAWTAAAAWAVK